jgi:hypothetical protein
MIIEKRGKWEGQVAGPAGHRRLLFGALLCVLIVLVLEKASLPRKGL